MGKPRLVPRAGRPCRGGEDVWGSQCRVRFGPAWPCAQGRAVCLWRDRIGDYEPGMCHGCNLVCRFFSLGSRLQENIY